MGEVHGYEYQQEMENRRREEESAAAAAAAAGGGGEVAPPGYEMATSTPTPGVGEAASCESSLILLITMRTVVDFSFHSLSW